MPKYVSPLEPHHQFVEDEHQRINVALWKEQSRFMERLQVRRRERAHLEISAVHRIQALYRGHCVRMKLGSEEYFRLNLRKKVRKGLKISLSNSGWTLSGSQHTTEMKSRRQTSATMIQAKCRSRAAKSKVDGKRNEKFQTEQEHSVRRIQSLARGKQAKLATERERDHQSMDSRLVACEVIQRATCSYLTSVKVRMRAAALHRVAAIMIQCCVRRFHQLKRVQARRSLRMS